LRLLSVFDIFNTEVVIQNQLHYPRVFFVPLEQKPTWYLLCNDDRFSLDQLSYTIAL